VGLSGPGGSIPKMVISEGSNREVTIKAPGQSEGLARRSLIQVIEAVYKAIGSESMMAATQWMRSGDTVLTFSGSVETHTRNIAWVEMPLEPRL
jgi:hypothetical protein